MIRRTLDELERATEERDAAQVVSCLKKIIPGYTPSVVALRGAPVPMDQAVGA
jgi:hypothetical protein